VVKPQNVNDIVSPLKEMGLEATIYDVTGVGKEKGERVA
jgi:nitrogen regulatory protein PII